ncbi:hypothetical protein EBX93_17005 [bacterium]|nr:hypothetical protein [bacterium]
MGPVKSQKGQTLVEYILLLVVAASLMMTFYRSKAFRRLFGEKGEIGITLLWPSVKEMPRRVYR